jgi:hypothetical protein
MLAIRRIEMGFALQNAGGSESSILVLMTSNMVRVNPKIQKQGQKIQYSRG